MLFAVICTDKPGSYQLRTDTRPQHVAWLEGLDAEGTLTFAGPFLGSDDKPNGSLVVISAADLKAAEQIASTDPYARTELFQSVDIRPWTWAFKKPETV